MKRPFGCWGITSIVLGMILSITQAQQVAITQIVEHPALDAIYQGILVGLDEAGFNKQSGLEVNYQVAQGNTTVATQIAKKFAGSSSDVIIAISTPSAQAVASATQTIPIIFSAVSDPVSAKLVNADLSPKGNVTGVMDFPPVEAQIQLIKTTVPNLSTIGVIYNPGEANSVAIIEMFKREAQKLGIQVLEGAATKTADVSSATKYLLPKVEAIYIPLDNTVISALEAVIVNAERGQIPVFAADTDSVKRGAVAALGYDYFSLGKQTAKMAARLLSGEKVEQIAVENVEALRLVVNPVAAEKQGLKFDADFLATAQEIIE